MLSLKHIKPSLSEVFGQNEKIQRMEERKGRKTNEKSMGVEEKAIRPSLICRPIKRSRKQAKLCEAVVPKSPA